MTLDPAPPVSNTLPPSAVRHIARRPPTMSAKRVWGLVRASFAAWGEDYASSMGAALSFYTVFSVAPVLLIAIAVAGLVFDTHAAQRAVASQLTGLMGREAAAAVEALLQSARSPSGGVISTTVGVVVLLIGASAVFGELQDALNRIWRAPVPRPPGLWRLVTERLLSFGMILGVGFLLIVSLVVSAAIAAFGQWWGEAFSYQALVLEVINFVLSVGVITLAFALIYKLIPRVSVQWHDVWIGAAVTALLFTVGKSLIGFYLGKTGVAPRRSSSLAPNSPGYTHTRSVRIGSARSLHLRPPFLAARPRRHRRRPFWSSPGQGVSRRSAARDGHRVRHRFHDRQRASSRRRRRYAGNLPSLRPVGKGDAGGRRRRAASRTADAGRRATRR